MFSRESSRATGGMSGSTHLHPLRLLVARHTTPEERSKVVFSMFDANQDGYLDDEELQEALQVIVLSSQKSKNTPEPIPNGEKTDPVAMPLAKMLVAMTMQKFDRDDDGRLSLAEWLAYAEYEDDVRKFEKRLAGVLTKPLIHGVEDPRTSDVPLQSE